jgi:hypothetical protein
MRAPCVLAVLFTCAWVLWMSGWDRDGHRPPRLVTAEETRAECLAAADRVATKLLGEKGTSIDRSSPAGIIVKGDDGSGARLHCLPDTVKP